MIKLQTHWSSMLSRVFFLIFLLSGSAIANEKAQDVEVLAQSVTKNGDIVHAVGNVVLYKKKYLFFLQYSNFIFSDQSKLNLESLFQQKKIC